MNNALSSTFQNAYNVIKSKVVNKQDKILSSAIGGATTVEGSLNNINNNIQKQDFTIPASVHAKVESPKTWVDMDWGDFNIYYSKHIWTDGNNIYYSDGRLQYILNKDTYRWNNITLWENSFVSGYQIWTDGDNIYYSDPADNQKVLNKVTNTWETKTWNYNIDGRYIWTDGIYIYYSYNGSNYVLKNYFILV